MTLLVVLIALALLAVISKNSGLYIVSGFGIMLYGFNFGSEWYYNLLIMLAGIFLVIMAFVKRS